MIPLDTSHILQWLLSGTGVMLSIQALKNLLPGIFEKSPNFARVLAAIGALIAGLVPCFVNGTGVDVGCVLTAVMTFLTAIGVYHSVAQSGGSVQAPLPAKPAEVPPGVGVAIPPK